MAGHVARLSLDAFVNVPTAIGCRVHVELEEMESRDCNYLILAEPVSMTAFCRRILHRHVPVSANTCLSPIHKIV